METKEEFLIRTFEKLVQEEVTILASYLIKYNKKYVFYDALIKKINGVEYTIYEMLKKLALPEDLVGIRKKKSSVN